MQHLHRCPAEDCPDCDRLVQQALTSYRAFSVAIQRFSSAVENDVADNLSDREAELDVVRDHAAKITSLYAQHKKQHT